MGFQIDRTRFLLLTTSIAASGSCTIERTVPRQAINIGPASVPGADVIHEDDAADQPDAEAGAALERAEDGATSIATRCIGDEDTEPDCAASSCSTECATIVKPRFKRGIANQVLGCMEMYPSCESVTSCIIERGTHNPDAGRAICDDPTAATFCEPLVDSCKKNGGKEIAMQVCVAMAKNLTVAARAQLASCITEGTPGYCTFDSSSCLDAMTY